MGENSTNGWFLCEGSLAANVPKSRWFVGWPADGGSENTQVFYRLPSLHSTWEWMIGRLVSIWDGLFSGPMLFEREGTTYTRKSFTWKLRKMILDLRNYVSPKITARLQVSALSFLFTMVLLNVWLDHLHLQNMRPFLYSECGGNIWNCHRPQSPKPRVRHLTWTQKFNEIHSETEKHSPRALWVIKL